MTSLEHAIYMHDSTNGMLKMACVAGFACIVNKSPFNSVTSIMLFKQAQILLNGNNLQEVSTVDYCISATVFGIMVSHFTVMRSYLHSEP